MLDDGYSRRRHASDLDGAGTFLDGAARQRTGWDRVRAPPQVELRRRRVAAFGREMQVGRRGLSPLRPSVFWSLSVTRTEASPARLSLKTAIPRLRLGRR